MNQLASLSAPIASRVSEGILIPCNTELNILQALELTHKTIFLNSGLKLILQRHSNYVPEKDIVLKGAVLTKSTLGDRLVGTVYKVEEVSYIVASMLATYKPLTNLFEKKTEYVFKTPDFALTIRLYPETDIIPINNYSLRLSEFNPGSIVMSSS